MKKRWLPIIMIGALLAVVVVLPAQADPDVTPAFVSGSTDCSVSEAPFSVTVVEPPAGVEVTVDLSMDVPDASITLANIERRSFDFTAQGVVIHDVIVKGSGSNHYDYGTSPVFEDDALMIPNGNKLNLVHFCFDEAPGVNLCDGPATASSEDGNATGNFSLRDPCLEGQVKTAEIAVINNEVVFIPNGFADAAFVGTITFVKVQDEPTDDTALVLQYDRDDNGIFRVVPDCEEGPSLPEGDDTWCVVSVTAEYETGFTWQITWNVYGEGDPRFR